MSFTRRSSTTNAATTTNSLTAAVSTTRLTTSSVHHDGNPNNDVRTGRHVVYNLHVHLVFVTKYRRNVFTDAMLARYEFMGEVCADFEAELRDRRVVSTGLRCGPDRSRTGSRSGPLRGFPGRTSRRIHLDA
jgi:hypothetical protein